MTNQLTQDNKASPPTEHSPKDLINTLYEKIWVLSDTIGFSLEVSRGRIPEKAINATGMAERLLVEGAGIVGEALELLGQIEQPFLLRPSNKAANNSGMAKVAPSPKTT